MSIALFKTKSIATKREERKWNNQEIADFYRAVDILKRAGLDVEVDSGVTDEGEPWLVFVRSGDGEVLAHFAQIDGQFVAVSSLNNEVYKGPDIRQIVDRMLDKHPLVVPKTANSGQLYLHPTAAVTAFLAAAFLLNVDGIKLSSVEEILVSVSTKGPSALASAAISVQSTGKGDIAKWGQLDAASTNYNVVVLGAALIAHKLGFSETVDVNSAEVETVSFDVNGDFIKGKAENDTSVLAKGLPDVVSASSYISEHEDPHFGINLKNKDDELKVISSKNQPKENQELKLDLSHKHFSNEGIVELSSSFMSSWESSNSELKQHYRDTNKSRDANKITPYEVNENFVRVEQVYPEEGDGIGMSSVPPTELSKTLIFNFDLAALVGSEDPQIALDNIDDMSLIALQEVNLTSDMVFLDNSLQNVYDGNNTLGLASLGEELAAPMIIEESSDSAITSVPIVDSVMQLPIIGHSTIDSKDGVDMTAGIDVVFYQGGDVEIKGFELGVDLLWFFLSEDELRTGQNTVNSEGDVVLDFGEMGSLVFLSLVPSSPDDILI